MGNSTLMWLLTKTLTGFASSDEVSELEDELNGRLDGQDLYYEGLETDGFAVKSVDSKSVGKFPRVEIKDPEASWAWVSNVCSSTDSGADETALIVLAAIVQMNLVGKEVRHGER